MSKTPLVDSLNLPTFKIVTRDGWEDATLINDIEAALEKLPKAQGAQLEGHGWCMCENAPVENATHTARLLGVQEIKREPLKKTMEFLDRSTPSAIGLTATKLAEEFAGKPLRITIEEIL